MLKWVLETFNVESSFPNVVPEFPSYIQPRGSCLISTESIRPLYFYKNKRGMSVLILILYVDETYCAGEKEEVALRSNTIESELKIET
jgi:hypothetical protein